MSHVLHKTEDWDEDFGDVLFFHFHNFEEPPRIICTSPLEVGFDEEYWTHFVTMNFNLIFDQAQQ
ncbi:MAG: hypothetical protein ABFS03_00735 [Chloroflexota bacterium]